MLDPLAVQAGHVSSQLPRIVFVTRAQKRRPLVNLVTTSTSGLSSPAPCGNPAYRLTLEAASLRIVSCRLKRAGVLGLCRPNRYYSGRWFGTADLAWGEQEKDRPRPSQMPRDRAARRVLPRLKVFARVVIEAKHPREPSGITAGMPVLRLGREQERPGYVTVCCP